MCVHLSYTRVDLMARNSPTVFKRMRPFSFEGVAKKKKRIRDKLVFSKLTHPYLQSTERKLKLLIRQKASIPLCRDLPKYA